jgi:threonyl-tRNA synthetase
MLIVGDKEVANNSVSVRRRSGEQTAAQPFDNFLESISADIANKV